VASGIGQTMKRRQFITLLGGTATWPLVARAQQPMHRIGHLAIAAPTDNPPPPPANWRAFVQGLREIGYLEGQNIAFEHRSAHDQLELFPGLALELAELKVEVIFARGTWALAAAKNATRTIPIVGIDLEIDPVESGLVASIARPGGNITGLFLDLSELSGKHLQLLKEIIPGTSRVAVLGNPDINSTQIRELERVARSLALQIRAVDVKNATDLSGAFGAAKDWRADALIVLSNPLSLAYRKQIGDFAEKAVLPAIYLYRAHVDAGGLISYGPDLPDMFRRCGGYVGRILGGIKPADLPVERPARFELIVNLKTAKALGVTIPVSILLRADEVID
jgi:putative ABC transport system substrate-binding protein